MDKAKLVGDVVTNWLKLAERRKTVVFATGVAHSVHIRDEFLRADVMAEHIDGTTPADERKEILANLSSGHIEVVTNAMVLTEGWDQPDVSCIVLARPTRQIGLYRQMAGRGLRPAPGKNDLLILDHAGAVCQHGFLDDDIEWTLDVDKRALNTAHKARSDGRADMLTTCPECSAVRLRGRPCVVCGWKPTPKPKAVEFIDGDLGRVDRHRRVHQRHHSEADQREFYDQLLWVASERGYQPGWAAHKFKEKFGVGWPNRNWKHDRPNPPDDATRSWVRSRQIAYAKSRSA